MVLILFLQAQEVLVRNRGEKRHFVSTSDVFPALLCISSLVGMLKVNAISKPIKILLDVTLITWRVFSCLYPLTYLWSTLLVVGIVSPSVIQKYHWFLFKIVLLVPWGMGQCGSKSQVLVQQDGVQEAHNDEPQKTLVRNVFQQSEEAQDNLIMARVVQEAQANKDRGREPLFKVGDFVLIITHIRCQEFQQKKDRWAEKLMPRFDGKYKEMAAYSDSSDSH